MVRNDCWSVVLLNAYISPKERFKPSPRLRAPERREGRGREMNPSWLRDLKLKQDSEKVRERVEKLMAIWSRKNGPLFGVEKQPLWKRFFKGRF